MRSLSVIMVGNMNKEEDTFESYQPVSTDNLSTDIDPSSTIFVLPERTSETGYGFYTQDSINLFKDLKEFDQSTAYYNEESSHRKYIERRSSPEELIISFVLGIVSNASWDALKKYLQRKKAPNSQVRGKVFKYKRNQNNGSWEEYSLKGTVDEAIRFIDEIKK